MCITLVRNVAEPQSDPHQTWHTANFAKSKLMCSCLSTLLLFLLTQIFLFQLMATTIIELLLGDLSSLQESLYHVHSLFDQQPPNIVDLGTIHSAAEVEHTPSENDETAEHPSVFRRDNRPSALVLQGLSSEVQILRNAISLPLQALNALMSMHIV
jgi:hypothetical protein